MNSSFDEHIHTWKTRYTAIDSIDCASGLECECGTYLRQDELEDFLNALCRNNPFLVFLVMNNLRFFQENKQPLEFRHKMNGKIYVYISIEDR